MAFFWQNQGTSDRIMVPKAHIAAHARASKAHRATTRARYQGRATPESCPAGPDPGFRRLGTPGPRAAPGLFLPGLVDLTSRFLCWFESGPGSGLALDRGKAKRKPNLKFSSGVEKKGTDGNRTRVLLVTSTCLTR